MGASKIKAPRGTFDVLGEEASRRTALEARARSILEGAGYDRIETPVFEATELFARGVGESTDIVRKEMFTFEDQAGRSLTLRPEGTAPVCRAYVEHGMHKRRQPVKLWYLSSFFRHERAQAGRYREFWQIGAEAIGSEDPAVDAESISLLAALLAEMGVRNLRLRLSSLGSLDSRREYRERLQAYLRANEASLSEEVRGRIELNPLRAFDSDHPGTQGVMRGAPLLREHLSEADAEHFAHVRALLDAAGVTHELDPTLVRGLDYYTRTVFEFTSDALGAQSGVGGGGRYDGLVEQLAGRRRPAWAGRRGWSGSCWPATAAALPAPPALRRRRRWHRWSCSSRSHRPRHRPRRGRGRGSTRARTCARRRSACSARRARRGSRRRWISAGARSKGSSATPTRSARATWRSSPTGRPCSRTCRAAGRSRWRRTPSCTPCCAATTRCSASLTPARSVQRAYRRSTSAPEMPKHDAMAQLSRPFQIVLVVVVLFACVWLFALQGRSTSTGGSGSTPVVSATTPSTPAPASTATGHAGTASSGSASTSAAAKAKAKATGTSTHVYHGSAPGLEGLTRDVNRAHEAVAAVGASPRTSSTTQTSSATVAPRSSSAAAPVKTPSPATKAGAQPASAKSTRAPASTVHKSSTAAPTTLAGQRTVEAELAKGDVVLLLFWNPKGTDDAVVHRAVQQVQRAERGRKVAVQEAPASQVASFGSVTRGVQVYATPTLFVINKHDQAIVLTGVQDAFSIEQAIDEAGQS
ncbi:MAG: histidine--tRNA ligase [Solirubrobacteraceae bacterium]